MTFNQDQICVFVYMSAFLCVYEVTACVYLIAYMTAYPHFSVFCLTVMSEWALAADSHIITETRTHTHTYIQTCTGSFLEENGPFGGTSHDSKHDCSALGNIGLGYGGGY